MLREKDQREQHITATELHLASFNGAIQSKFPGGLVSAIVNSMACTGLLEMEDCKAGVVLAVLSSQGPDCRAATQQRCT